MGSRENASGEKSKLSGGGTLDRLRAAEGGGEVRSSGLLVALGAGAGSASGQVVESGVGGAALLVVSKSNLKPPRSGRTGAGGGDSPEDVVVSAAVVGGMTGLSVSSGTGGSWRNCGVLARE